MPSDKLSFSSLYSFIYMSKTFCFSLLNEEPSEFRLFCYWGLFLLKFIGWGIFLIELFLDKGLNTKSKWLDSYELLEF